MNMNVNLPAMGNIHSYVKSLKLQNDFNQKKRTGDLTRHESGSTSWIEEEAKKNAENAKMGRISSKIMSGKKLTPAEEDYLREKSPQGYQDYRRNLEEQKAFEERVRRCKTKDEVKQLKIDKINAAMTTVKAAEKAMGKGAANIAMAELGKLQGFNRIITDFIESGEYEKLPTEAELAQAEKELREAEQAERQPETEQTEQHPDPEKAEQPAKADQAEKPVQSEKKVAQASGVKQSAKSGIAEPESPEARKVRHAKAKAAYAAAQKVSDELSPAETETCKKHLNRGVSGITMDFFA